MSRVLAKAVPPVFLSDGDGQRLGAHALVIAQWQSDGRLLYCEVIERQSKDKLRCNVINGAWSITFDAERRGSTKGSPDIHAKLIMLLPGRLAGVSDMDDWEQVIRKCDSLIAARAKSTTTKVKS